MLITHDLGVVAEVCTRVVVMYLGQIIEEAEVGSLFSEPLHPYTKGLLKSVPRLDGDRSKSMHVIEGMVPSLNNIPKGCRFSPRCSYSTSLCEEKPPELKEIEDGHKVRCWHYETVIQEGRRKDIADIVR